MSAYSTFHSGEGERLPVSISASAASSARRRARPSASTSAALLARSGGRTRRTRPPPGGRPPSRRPFPPTGQSDGLDCFLHGRSAVALPASQRVCASKTRAGTRIIPDPEVTPLGLELCGDVLLHSDRLFHVLVRHLCVVLRPRTARPSGVDRRRGSGWDCSGAGAPPPARRARARGPCRPSPRRSPRGSNSSAPRPPGAASAMIPAICMASAAASSLRPSFASARASSRRYCARSSGFPLASSSGQPSSEDRQRLVGLVRGRARCGPGAGARARAVRVLGHAQHLEGPTRVARGRLGCRCARRAGATASSRG